MEKELKSRRDIPVELTWDLSLIYATEEEMNRDVERAKSLCNSIVKDYKGKLDTPQAIRACLDDLREFNRLVMLVGHYCDLAVSVDYYDTHNQERNEAFSSLTADMFSRLSFIGNEIAGQEDAVVQEAIDLSAENRQYLQNILRMKPHLLHPETERAVAALSQTIQAPYQIYNMAKLADMKFDNFSVDGREYPLGYSLFENNYEYERDTAVRRGAFEAFYAKISDD